MLRVLLYINIFCLILISLLIQKSIAPFIFPIDYFYIFFGILFLFLFSQINFDILRYFSPVFYIVSIILLVITLILGEVTRGAVRWIPLGSFTFQPSEFARPFVLLFIAHIMTIQKYNIKKLLIFFSLFFLPWILIFLQPSLGVSILLLAGFGGILLSAGFKWKYFIILFSLAFLSSPMIWIFLAPYQKERILSIGVNYNAVQSKISVGAGGVFGRGLGQGVQTQLSFLPERHTDFVFASIAEEMGFVGALITLILLISLLYMLIKFLDIGVSRTARMYLSAVFITLFVQVIIHIGMNMGLFPITGLPLPLVSAGGSSLMAILIMLGISISASKTHA